MGISRGAAGALIFGLVTAGAEGLGAPREVWLFTLSLAALVVVFTVVGDPRVQRRYPVLAKLPLVVRYGPVLALPKGRPPALYSSDTKGNLVIEIVQELPHYLRSQALILETRV